MAVLVMDKQGTPLMPCSEKRARLLLERGRARVHRIMPFVIRLVGLKAENCAFQSLRIKLDPGSKTTGVAVVLEKSDRLSVLNLFELIHRGRQIGEALTARRALRRRRDTCGRRAGHPDRSRPRPAGRLQRPCDGCRADAGAA